MSLAYLKINLSVGFLNLGLMKYISVLNRCVGLGRFYLSFFHKTEEL